MCLVYLSRLLSLISTKLRKGDIALASVFNLCLSVFLNTLWYPIRIFTSSDMHLMLLFWHCYLPHCMRKQGVSMTGGVCPIRLSIRGHYGFSAAIDKSKCNLNAHSLRMLRPSEWRRWITSIASISLKNRRGYSSAPIIIGSVSLWNRYIQICPPLHAKLSEWEDSLTLDYS